MGDSDRCSQHWLYKGYSSESDMFLFTKWKMLRSPSETIRAIPGWGKICNRLE